MPTRDEHDQTERTTTRRPWEKPVVKDLGRVRDLVRGGGKSVEFGDSDPQTTVKHGGG